MNKPDRFRRSFNCWTIAMKIRRMKDPQYSKWFMAFKSLDGEVLPFFATEKAARAWLKKTGRKTNMAIAWKPVKVRVVSESRRTGVLPTIQEIQQCNKE